MSGESILEIEKIKNSQREDISIAVFKIVDGIKDILEEDRQQKQPLILSINEKLIIKTVKEIIEEYSNMED
mgnify:CR=1 FL=1